MPGSGLEPSRTKLDAAEAARFIGGLHLRHEFGVGALRLDERDDAGRLAFRVGAHQPVRQVRPSRVPAVRGLFDGVLLHQHPLVAAVLERLGEFVGDVRVVGQRHLRGREAAHAGKRLEAEDGGEMVLPSLHMQAVVLHRRAAEFPPVDAIFAPPR